MASSAVTGIYFTAVLHPYGFVLDQRWGVTKYKITLVLFKEISQVSVLYLSVSFSDDFLLLLLIFVHNYLHSLLWKNTLVAFMFRSV